MTNNAAGLRLSYRGTFGLYSVFMFFLFLPFFFGEVIAPDRQTTEVGLPDALQAKSAHFENRKFSDYTNAYIPEISKFLTGPRSGRVALWTDSNELGRPLYHISGFSPVYLPALIISKFTRNPWRFITVLSVLFCYLAGAFIFLLCRELRLDPVAGLVAGLSLSASPLFIYWLTFPMFSATWCWTAGCLWAAHRLMRKADLFGWGVLAFSAYSLLMTGYPQLVVFQIYFMGAVGILLAARLYREDAARMIRFLCVVGSAACVAGLLALPVYYDIFITSLNSGRMQTDLSFFQAALPHISSPSDVARLFVFGVMPNIFGSITSPDFPLPYDGLSATLLMTFFVLFGVVAGFGDGRGWWLAIGTILMVVFVHPIYDFAVAHLGFGLSRSNPLSMLMFPTVMLGAYAVDTLSRGNPRCMTAIVYAVGGVLGALAAGIAYGLMFRIPIHWSLVVTVLVITSLLAAQWRGYRPGLLLLACLMSLAAFSFPSMLRQQFNEVRNTSPLVAAVHARLPDDSRFAVAAPGIAALPPNFNSVVGLSSIHSYDSLSSSNYQAYIKALDGRVLTYGRWNDAVSPQYSSALFWMSNVALVLASTQLQDENLRCPDQVDGVWLCAVRSRMGRTMQIATDGLSASPFGWNVGDPRARLSLPSTQLTDSGDVQTVAVSSVAKSLLIISQRYHRDWHAEALQNGHWIPAATTMVNGFFEGVVLPSDSSMVRLAFKPFARFASIANFFWLALIGLIMVRILSKHWVPLRRAYEQQ
jgi:hypothetical protein